VDIDDLLRKAGDALYVGRSFGPTYEHQGTLVIPVALVAGGGGGGSQRGVSGGGVSGGGVSGGGVSGGGGAQTAPGDERVPSDQGSARRDSEESGGGFGGVVYPVGAYVVREGRARFVPTVDVNLAVVCGLLVCRLVLKRFRHRRR
jgi:hypothetical protein